MGLPASLAHRWRVGRASRGQPGGHRSSLPVRAGSWAGSGRGNAQSSGRTLVGTAAAAVRASGGAPRVLGLRATARDRCVALAQPIPCSPKFSLLSTSLSHARDGRAGRLLRVQKSRRRPWRRSSLVARAGDGGGLAPPRSNPLDAIDVSSVARAYNERHDARFDRGSPRGVEPGAPSPRRRRRSRTHLRGLHTHSSRYDDLASSSAASNNGDEAALEVEEVSWARA